MAKKIVIDVNKDGSLDIPMHGITKLSISKDNLAIELNTKANVTLTFADLLEMKQAWMLS